MSLAVILGAAKLAMEVGPAAIRGISSLFGGSDTADKVAEMVEQVDGVLGMTGSQKEAALARELQKLPAESLVELERLKIEMDREVTRRQQLAYEDAQSQHRETQETIRAGDKAEDPYIRTTRPLMARQSMWATMLYCLGMEALRATGYGSGVDVAVAALLSSPAWAFLGLRTLDGFAPYPKGSGAKVTGTLLNLFKGR
ncbi:hypothetical protein [Shewanella khirikhana]|uniref:Holin of 3TMs, for gene-transfer release n=1 Tax=Shewanella khirikhana TaxID=1965282 RepID=A0ABM7D1J2_9GAMM|nr:hypothetical protein [Shewanella khirikhana]AZQ10145.1 hypothetical protein STH12_01009 [Shewanella khirikhana]